MSNRDELHSRLEALITYLEGEKTKTITVREDIDFIRHFLKKASSKANDDDQQAINNSVTSYLGFTDSIQAAADDFQEIYGDYERGRTDKQLTLNAYVVYQKVCIAQGKLPLSYQELVAAQYVSPWKD